MTIGVEHYPRIYEFAIGDNPSIEPPGDPANPTPVIDGSDTNDYNTVAVGIPQGVSGPDAMTFMVENKSPTNSMVVSIQSSNDNGIADTYAALTLRNGGTTASSFTIVPLGRLTFTLDPNASLKKYIRFVVPGASAPATPPDLATVGTRIANAALLTKPFGRWVATFFNGQLDRVERAGIA